MTSATRTGFIGEFAFSAVGQEINVVFATQWLTEFVVMRGDIGRVVSSNGVGDKTIGSENGFLDIGQHAVCVIVIAGFEFRWIVPSIPDDFYRINRSQQFHS